ncbi:MAG: valine--pyruvate transaminase [Planctomycetota bacterium]
MRLSRFAERFGPDAGIVSLMDDLGAALHAADPDTCMLGGGNPAHIPAVQTVFRRRMQALLDEPGRFERLLGDYAPPVGMPELRAAIAERLAVDHGWAIGPEHVALTSGSQSAFFALFNSLGGRHADGRLRRICFPLVPEYIGYADLMLEDGALVGRLPRIEQLADGFFKYHIDFDRLQLDADVGAVCVSRPTNPSGNVLSDAELQRLGAACRSAGVPLIIDNAYGAPFPGILFTDTTPYWDEHVIYCLSLSKIGLPATRTGIVIGPPALVQRIGAFNAITSLAGGSLGAGLASELIRSGELQELSRSVVRPFYEDKMHRAVARLQAGLRGLPCRLHRPEGALFLWLWCPGLPIDSQVLYERLKRAGVIVVAGHHFFPGLDRRMDWPHRRECLRITYAQDDAVVARGIDRVCEAIRAAYG